MFETKTKDAWPFAYTHNLKSNGHGPDNNIHTAVARLAGPPADRTTLDTDHLEHTACAYAHD
ncbi:hypothetical protein NH8B_3975 [Pseudogulbenkiania sp. NH8B]|nr:hypothetical protein NH8B_3975 [Pseudogulbenkiania sp. NH8B]